MPTPSILSSWPLLLLWQRELDEQIHSWRLGTIYTARKGRAEMHFETPAGSRVLSWQKEGHSAHLELQSAASLPRRRVALMQVLPLPCQVHRLRIHRQDRLLKMELEEGYALQLGFYPGQLNIYLQRDGQLLGSFLKQPAYLGTDPVWLTHSDRDGVSSRLEDLGQDPGILEGVDWDPATGQLVPASGFPGIQELSRRILAGRTGREPEIDWVQQGRTVLKRWRRKQRNMEREYREAQDHPEDLIHIQCIQIALATGLKPTNGQLQIPAELSPDGVARSIPLADERTPLPRQIDVLFQKQRRSKRARDSIAARLPVVEAEIRALEQLLDTEDATAVQAFLLDHGERTPGTRRQPAERTPYKRYPSPGGLDILVGRSARDNDALTFGVAGKHDWWFHARGVPGSHVVLRTGRQKPRRDDLEAAAELAARHSDAKHAGVVVVQYCQRKHVSKPRGAAPGVVRLHREETLTIDLEETTSGP